MNIKLLKELYKQAETECGWSEEKFAELIVRECMDVVAKKCASPTAYQSLAEHWGVEL